ncbi:MAG TPA: DUF885 domain-containing protein [Allosphingosinicella sp.]|jgi:uncharacterized protein (DUF885 family)
MRSGKGFAETDRRALIAGLGASAVLLLPHQARAATPAAPPLKTLLDHALQAYPTHSEMLRRLRAGPAAALGREDAAILKMVVRGIECDEAMARDFPLAKPGGGSPYVVSQRHGAWRDVEDGPIGPVNRFHSLEVEADLLRAAAARGIVPPAFMLGAVEAGLKARFAKNPPAAVVREIETVRSLGATAPREPGVWQFPGGPDYYALRLRSATGTDMTPADLDRLVTERIAVLTRRLDGLLKRLGLSRGSVGARLRALKQRPDYLYPNNDAGREHAVADMNAALDRLRPRLAAWFNPPFEANARVRRMSAADEAAGKRGYRDPSSETYYPDLANVHDRPAWTLTTVACHETLPGHMIELRREERAAPHPLQLRYAAGAAEGWAIYAESLADRIGLLSPIEQAGFLQSCLFRLARVVADLGIHVHRWTRARAIAYLEDTVGFELFFPFAQEVDRYAAEPAGFAGDAAHALTLIDLARRRGDPRAFHDRVLNRGPLSLEALLEIA